MLLHKDLLYQPVLHDDGTVAIHEAIIDKDGKIISATYEPIKLECTSLGELEALLRQIYKDIRRLKPMTEEELETTIYGIESSSNIYDEDDNVIDMLDFISR